MSDVSTAGSEPRFLDYEVKGAVAWIMLDRPHYANSQNYRLLNQLDDALSKIAPSR